MAKFIQSQGNYINVDNIISFNRSNDMDKNKFILTANMVNGEKIPFYFESMKEGDDWIKSFAEIITNYRT